jgi:VWFA-related protein
VRIQIASVRLAISLLFAAAAAAQTSTAPPMPPLAGPPAQAPNAQNQPEMTSRDVPMPPATFHTGVNLVMVPVVVRDSHGNAVGTLTKDDFRLFDKGKTQAITKFTVERSKQPAPRQEPGLDVNIPNPHAIADHFVLYLFDDLRLTFADLTYVRRAADSQIAEMLSATTRAAIYTTSGIGDQDFTDSVPDLRDALNRLRARSQHSSADCPEEGYLEAKLIQQGDQAALDVATNDAIQCANLDPSLQRALAEQMAQSVAQRVVALNDAGTHLTLTVLQDAIRRIASMPGQRMIVVISPGFVITDEYRGEETDVLNRAIRSSVIVGTLDARGLAVQISGGDASERNHGSIATQAQHDEYDRQTNMLQMATLAELADTTGGAWVHDTNDLLGGLRRIASPPESYYVLGFSPLDLKMDGHFHALKVTLVDGKGLSIQARKGYWAPRHATDASEQIREDIHDAVFSREEIADIPMEFHTQFFKTSDTQADLSVLTHVDLSGLQFQRAEGRNNDTLVVVAALFDTNGNYINGNEQRVEMRLRDATLHGRLSSGITLRSEFQVAPGPYVIRVVVRDSQGQAMAARNGQVDIPYQ